MFRRINCESCHHIYYTGKNPGEFEECPQCKHAQVVADTREVVSEEYARAVYKKPVNKERYPALNFIAGFYKFLAAAVGLAVILLILLLQKNLNVATPEVLVGIIVGLFLVGALVVITLVALAEGIQIFIDIEKNTRAAPSLAKTANEAPRGLADKIKDIDDLKEQGVITPKEYDTRLKAIRRSDTSLD